MTQDTLLRRIRALMAKAASTDSEHEASALTTKVRELMEQHQLTMADVTQQNTHDPLGCSTVVLPYGDRCYQEIAWRLGTYLGCFCTISQQIVDGRTRRVAKFWGREGARVAATEMYPYLVVASTRVGGRLWRECPYASRSVVIRETMNALAARLHRLAHEKPASSPIPGALVPVPEAEAWAREQSGAIRTVKSRMSFTAAARQAAEGISLAGQVSATVDPTRLLS